MALELSGKVISLLPEQTGSGKNGTWSKIDFVIETEDQYPKKVCFSSWGDKVAQVKGLQPGQKVKVSFNVESREFNGKWYTDLRIWKLETNSQNSAQGEGSDFEVYPISANDEYLSAAKDSNPSDDLPF